MRLQKDQRHAELEDQFDGHRRSTAEQLNAHSENITMLESLKLNLQSKILGHE